MLKNKALDLLSVLQGIIDSLDKYESGLDDISRKRLSRLKTHTENYQTAITDSKDRASAQKSVKYLNSIIIDVNNANERPGMRYISDALFSRYWDLYNIFQDGRFKDDQL